MLPCTLQGLTVGDAEAYHAGIAKMHAVDAGKVGQLGFVKLLLCTRDTGRGYHVDKSVGMLIDKADSLL